MNKYTRWYNQIIDRARFRIIDDYTETHHIQPRSLGGSDNADNLVDLTAREHFVCHWLLVKMHTGDARKKMISALYLMRGVNTYQERYINSRVYESLRQEYAEYISSLNSGRVQPPEEKVKQIAAQTGRKRAPFSEEWRTKMAEKKKGENNPRYGVEVLDSTRKKIGDKIRGRKQTDEEKARRGAANRGKVKPKLLCPHCEKMIAVNTYPRWHGPNCRRAPR
jgi:hypothetical protein